MYNKTSSPRLYVGLLLFPSKCLNKYAEEVGVVNRNRKTQMPAPVWASVFDFAAGESRTLAGFRCSCNVTAARTSLGRFHQWLTLAFAEYLYDLVDTALNEVNFVRTSATHHRHYWINRSGIYRT